MLDAHVGRAEQVHIKAGSVHVSQCVMRVVSYLCSVMTFRQETIQLLIVFNLHQLHQCKQAHALSRNYNVHCYHDNAL